MRINFLGRPVLRLIAASFLLILTVDCSEEPSSSGCDVSGPGGGASIERVQPSWQVAVPVNLPDAISGTSATNIFGVGHDSIFRFDGTSWTSVQSPVPYYYLFDVWAADATHAFAVGQYGTILEFDGSTWTAAPVVTAERLLGVWGSGPDDVFAVGERSVLHFDGASWSGTVVIPPPYDHLLTAVWGNAHDDVFVVSEGYGLGVTHPILHFDGNNWSPMVGGSTSGLRSVWSSGPGNAVAVGAGGTIMRYNGTSWSHMVTEGSVAPLQDVWGSSSTNAYAASLDRVYHFDGSNWTPITVPVTSVTDVWGTSASDVFLMSNDVDLNQFGRFDGTSWKSESIRPDDKFTSVWSTAHDRYSAGADGVILHGRLENYAWIYNGMETGTTETLNALWKTSEKFMCVGEQGTILTLDGESWTSMTSGATVALNGVWGRLSNFVAVGDGGTILQYKGAQWLPLASGVGVDLTGVWGTTMSDLYAVGKGGTILHYGGSVWKPMTSGTSADLTAVWGVKDGPVYAVGANGTVLRYTKSTWSAVTSGTTALLTSIWGASADRFFVGGVDGIHCWEAQLFIRRSMTPVVGGHSNSGNSSVAVTGAGIILNYVPGNL